MTKKVVVIGSGMTQIRPRYEDGLKEIYQEATQMAIEDANSPKIDAIFAGNMNASHLSGQANLGSYLVEAAGFRDIPGVHVEGACGSGGLAVTAGYRAVASGLYDTVIASGVEKMSENKTSIVNDALVQAADQEYEAYHGASFSALNALLFRYYMEHYKIPREDFALWPVAMHAHAVNNPKAQLQFTTTQEKALKSIMIADPLRLFDCSPIGDGAAALIFTTEENAKKIAPDQPLIEIAGVGEAVDTIAIYRREDLLGLKATRVSSTAAYTMAGISPKDIDVAEVHDAFSIMGILALEDLGFAKPGRCLDLLRNDKVNKDGTPPINMSGGLKARGHPVGATGVYQSAEIFNQLRGTAGKMQVDDPKIGIAQSIGGSGADITSVILRRVD